VIHDLSSATKHALDMMAFGAAVVAGITLANAALFMTFLAAICSVLWFLIRLYDRVKYGPNVND
jgi:hypothetical protein